MTREGCQMKKGGEEASIVTHRPPDSRKVGHWAVWLSVNWPCGNVDASSVVLQIEVYTMEGVDRDRGCFSDFPFCGMRVPLSSWTHHLETPRHVWTRWSTNSLHYLVTPIGFYTLLDFYTPIGFCTLLGVYTSLDFYTLLAHHLVSKVKTPQLLHFRSRPEGPHYQLEEIAHPTSGEPIKIHRKNIPLFKTWLAVDAPGRMLFSTWQVSLTRKCLCHSFPVTAASNARLQRQSKKRPHLGIERWNYFLFARLFFVPRKP